MDIIYESQFSCLFLEVNHSPEFWICHSFVFNIVLSQVYIHLKMYYSVLFIFELYKSDDILYVIYFILLDRQKLENLTISSSLWSLK